MKKMLIVILLCSSVVCFAQKKAESAYTQVFAEFVKAYNNIDADGIAKLFTPEINPTWTKEDLKKQHKEWGKITGFKYIGPFNGKIDVHGNVNVYYKVSFDKKATFTKKFAGDTLFIGKDVHAAAIALNDKNLISGCSLWTSSKEIDSMISKY